MANKFETISELYRRTCKTVVMYPQNWEAFLRSACRNYKLRFDEQLLIYAQRPDATAVLEIERWNGTFGRWVNKGATGIAVFDDINGNRQRLIHYFDISDTHSSRNSKTVPILAMKPGYENEIVNTLEKSFGKLENRENIESAIISASKNIVDDNASNYISDLIYFTENSLLAGLSEEEIATVYKRLAQNSVAYMLMSRLDIDADAFFDSEDFNDIMCFTTPETLNALGIAVSDISEICLTEIFRTISTLDKQNRTFVKEEKSSYNIKKENHGGNFAYETNQLHNAGRLQSSELDNAETSGSELGQIRSNEKEFSQGTSQGNLLQSVNELHSDRTFSGNRTESFGNGRNSHQTDGETGRDYREPESGGYDVLGSEDEQYSQPSSGNGVEADSLRLDYYDRSNDNKSLPFFGGDDTIREILGITPHLKASKDEIRAFFETVTDDDKRTEYIKGIFNNDYTEVILSDDRRVGYKTFQNVLHLWEGSYLSRTAQSYYDWGVIAGHFEAMRLLGELQDKMKPLPSISGQMSLMLDYEAEVTKPSAFSFSQEIIDLILCKGSQVSEGKFRIYEQFQKSLSQKGNVDFLKNEYGFGGSYPIFIGTGIDELHDAKGMKISKKINGEEVKLFLNWSQVEKRISELIKMDRYLNSKEKTLYPQWLEQHEIHRAENTEEYRKREILSTVPSEKKEPEPTNDTYEYHLGNTVYIGADEYEILSFDDERVMLYDLQFPLFNKEMTRNEFDQKVRENPMNDHLKVTKIHTASEQTPTNNKEIKHMYREYLAVKNDNPESIVFYQVGDFFEAYGDDAKNLVEIFDLVLTSRTVSAEERVPMLGVPKHRLETYITMLTDRGYDVAISALENGKRKAYSLVSQNKEDPIESKPIGRIDYLHTDGRVRESIEYTSPYQLEKDIKEENRYGVPMSVVLYRQADGSVIPHTYIAECDPPLKGFTVIDNPFLKSSVDIAKNLIDEYDTKDRTDYSDISKPTIICEWSESPVFEDGKTYSIADFDKLMKSANAERIAGRNAAIEKYGSAEAWYNSDVEDEYTQYYGYDKVKFTLNMPDGRTFTERQDVGDGDGGVIEFLSQYSQYNDIIPILEKAVADLSVPIQNDDLSYNVESIEKASASTVPAWEKPRKNRVQSFDLHPDIPMAERHNFDLANNEIEEVNKKERFYRNFAAIKVLKDCVNENRFATPEEQELLSKYVGWGGIPEAFDERVGAWRNEYTMLKNILTPEEYASARESTRTAFYTPTTVIKAVYKALEQLGFREGNILEPSCGIGHFIGMLPESMKEAKVYGVEFDTISAGIAQQLYQKSSIAAQGFEKTNLPDSCFDAVVGNVPFDDFKVYDKRYDKYKFLIHDYFFAKSLDKLRPGGVMALITSKGTMDKKNSAVRKYIAQRAELLGAIRLPNNTFNGNAGTKVVSDILILQKRDCLIDVEPDWVHLEKDENGRKINSYFVQHPEMVLGEWKTVSGRYGDGDTVVPFENTELSNLLDAAISNIHGEITAYEFDDELTEEDNSIPADPTVRNFSYTVVDDTVYFRENSRMTPVDVSATAENRIKGMIGIRDSVRTLIELQTEDYPDYEIKAEQENLNKLYDAFTAKYGLINSRANTSAFSQDSSYSLLSALEILDDEGNLERKADMFFKRTIKPHTPVTSVDTSSEALAVSMGEKACVDMEYMCQLSGKNEAEVYADLKGVIFLNPQHSDMLGYPKYLMADEYLSGNVREKLAFAKKATEMFGDDYKINVEALEKVQPKDLTASEISVRLGATWLPLEIVEQFIFEFLGTPIYNQHNIKLHFSKHTGEWNIAGKSYDKGNVKAYNTYGTARINAYKIIEETLNLKDVRIFDYIEELDGKKKAVLNKKETAIAQSKQELIKQGFQGWIWADPKRRERLCKLYNEKFNSIRPREYDGSHITFNGMNSEIELREHQKNAVAHIIYGGNTLLAHAVGAGKTFEMVAAAMESKRLGLCNKSLFVVPNHLTEQWAAEFLQLYPSANILVATKKDFETKNRKRFCGRIATGDYDAVIIGHSQFEKIPMSIERQRASLEQQLNEVTMGIADLNRSRGDNFSVKQLERTKKSIKQKLDKLNDQIRKDDVVTFEELGVDRLFVDESHYYKNLFLYTKMRNVSGIAQTEAMKSSDLFMKCRYLDEITGGRGTVFATGTPISNSMVELYTIQRYLQYNTLVKNKLQHFDAWASTFGETITAVELTPEGSGYRAKTRFARFYNLPELMAMFKEVADIKTADMLDLPVPKANFHNISVKPSEIQKQMVAELAERAEKVRNGIVDASVDNMLKITNDGRKLALDQRLINPLLPDFEGSKLNACVDAMFETWEKGKEKRLTQLFFCDLSTPKNDGNFSVYDDIRKKLIERGVPADEIKFIHEADTEAKKLELFKKVRRGDVRILMGSTQKMGAGTNVQNKLAASTDLDCPWRPSDLEQRLGRSIRQGNENLEVDIYRFVTEETFDAYLYQLVEGKQKFASQIMTSKSPVRSCEDIDETALSYAEIKMLATGNPHIKEKMDLDIQVQKLRLLKSNFLSERYALEDKIIKFYPQDIARRTETIKSLKADIERVAEHPKPLDDTFVGMTVKGAFYSEKAYAGNAILEACQAMANPEPIPLGEYRGFQMELYFETFSKEYKVKLKGELGYPVTLGTDTFGNIPRFDNVLEGLPKRLEINEQELENTKKQFETAKVDVCRPFNLEEELQTKTARLNELNALLNVNKRENEIVGGEPDEQNQASVRKHKEIIRCN